MFSLLCSRNLSNKLADTKHLSQNEYFLLTQHIKLECVRSSFQRFKTTYFETNVCLLAGFFYHYKLYGIRPKTCVCPLSFIGKKRGEKYQNTYNASSAIFTQLIVHQALCALILLLFEPFYKERNQQSKERNQRSKFCQFLHNRAYARQFVTS